MSIIPCLILLYNKKRLSFKKLESRHFCFFILLSAVQLSVSPTKYFLPAATDHMVAGNAVSDQKIQCRLLHTCICIRTMVLE